MFRRTAACCWCSSAKPQVQGERDRESCGRSSAGSGAPPVARSRRFDCARFRAFVAPRVTVTAVSSPATSSVIGISNADPALSVSRRELVLNPSNPHGQLVLSDSKIREAEPAVGIGGGLDRHVGIAVTNADEGTGDSGTLRIEHASGNRALIDGLLGRGQSGDRDADGNEGDQPALIALSSPWCKSRPHTTGDASPMTALFLRRILPDILGRHALSSGRLTDFDAAPGLAPRAAGRCHDVVPKPSPGPKGPGLRNKSFRDGKAPPQQSHSDRVLSRVPASWCRRGQISSRRRGGRLLTARRKMPGPRLVRA